MTALPSKPSTPSERTPLTSGDPEATSYSGLTSRQDAHEYSQQTRGLKRVAHRLYISHFLSTWNSRVFEFGAVLYLASVYPGTLLPMSIYALSRGLAAIILAPAVGHYIDVGNRLQVVRLSIVLQRLVVAASCIMFYLRAIRLPILRGYDGIVLACLAFLACVEKVCSIMNLVSVERDWVVVVAGEDHERLKTMNAQMRRIDLIFVEYYSIARVYYEVPELQQPKSENYESLNVESDQRTFLVRVSQTCFTLTQKALGDFASYTRHSVFLPSFAGSLLYLTVLSFAGQMVTWLLSTGYNSMQVGIARTLSVAFEILATWIAPWLMGKIGPTRAGLWLANWQITSLTAGISIFWTYSDQPLISATGLVGATILSRVGLRGFDLCTQISIQEGVEAGDRGSFSSIEAAGQNAFEIGSYVSTIVFSRPDQFRWPVLISVIAVGLAGVLYTVFVRIQRGHLVHIPSWVISKGDLQRTREHCIERISSSSDF
ncbi:hypothetical protein BBP40_000922 [Aspergillus hancockii]|nr:hypothetical protein BBP40_000922 [Aspergillus hancockii]